jgi:hypothetical protein
MRAKAKCRAHRHGGVHAVLTDLVASSRHNPTSGNPTDNEGFTDQAWVVVLFDGRIKGVHIHM